MFVTDLEKYLLTLLTRPSLQSHTFFEHTLGKGKWAMFKSLSLKKLNDLGFKKILDNVEEDRSFHMTAEGESIFTAKKFSRVSGQLFTNRLSQYFFSLLH